MFATNDYKTTYQESCPGTSGYQLVAELANPYLTATKRRELIRQKAQIQHEVPFLGPRR